jgi:hypothetical protein
MHTALLSSLLRKQPVDTQFNLNWTIAPLIQRPTDSQSALPYYLNYDSAKHALGHTVVMNLLLDCASVQFIKAFKSRRQIIMTNGEDLFSECYRGLLNKLTEGGMRCENFESPSFNTESWLRTVFNNQAKDRLKYKVPKAHHRSIEASKEEEGRTPINVIFSGYNAVDTIEFNEGHRIKEWFETLTYTVADSALIHISPHRRLIWKLLHRPNLVQPRDFKCVNIRGSRPISAISSLFNHHKEALCDIVKFDNIQKLQSKNFITWLFFGGSFISCDEMLKRADPSWLNEKRDNQIRRTLNRADTQIWECVLYGLLSKPCFEGYEALNVELIVFALHRAKNTLPPARKTKAGFANTVDVIRKWATRCISPYRKTSFTHIKEALSILTSVGFEGRDWYRQADQRLVDKSIDKLQKARKIVQ